MKNNHRKPLYDQIEEYLLRLIGYNLKNSISKIPSENFIAHQFNVSRTTSKRAINNLVDRGFLIRIKGSGTYINENLDELQLLELNSYGDTPKCSLTSKQKNTIGLILPDIKSKYMLNIIDGVQNLAIQNEFSVILGITMYDPTLEKNLIIKMLSSTNALIIFPINKQIYNQEIIKLSLRKFPVVVLDNTLQGIETSTVMSNNRKAAKQATHYFLKNGKKNIGVISHPLDSTLSLRERYKGYELALAEYNISVNSHHILDKLNHYDIHSTKKIIHFINNNPNIDALLAFNYELGIKTINTTLNNSVHLTYKDIIIFDEEFADIYNLLKIKIKYIQQDAYAIGETACQIILNQFNSPTYLTQHITIDTKLFV